MKRILCFGDSLTWGHRASPDGGVPDRYPSDSRWTGVLAQSLGGMAEVVEEGLNGRTTNLDDPEAPYRNGATFLPVALRSHAPLDLVVLMLGTNDSKDVFRRSSADIAVALAGLARQVLSFSGADAFGPTPSLLLVAPPPVRPDPDSWLGQLFEGAGPRLAGLPPRLAALAAAHGAGFLDAGRVLTTDGADGVHLSEANNRALGEAIAEAARTLLA